MPSPDLLYTQNERVEVGTVENTVSILTVSVENVRVFDGDRLNESSSVQAARKANATVRHIVDNNFPIALL